MRLLACTVLVGTIAAAFASSTAVDAQRAPGSAPDCVRPANRIVAENCKPGNPSTEWDVNGSGDLKIQGFATDISVNAGETISFKVDSSSPAYRIDIYRLGYYGGMGARQVASIKPSVAVATVAARMPDRHDGALVRLRQLGRVGVMGGAARRGLRGFTSPASCARTTSRRRGRPDNSRTTAPRDPRPRRTPTGRSASASSPTRSRSRAPATSTSWSATTRAGPISCSRRWTPPGRRTTGPASPAPMAASIRPGRWSAPTKSA